ncbi:uncharacterized protein LOC132175600 isoform X2 [Corylus avellana]|uniref:uncharacterized protein LOC132175600 isoform X2 n=1 Tax=Corylus avellana TaxID=13451 RepID=UPI00286BA24B|nr:uncharacterized protein LOC132175600 isoform X2 [Corylus avellana]
MWVNLQWIPEDWICESCLSNNIVSLEASRKKDTIRTMPLDSPDVVCHESIHTLGPSSRGRASSRRQKTVETGKVKFIPTEEVIRLSSRATEKGNPLRLKIHDSVGPSGLVKFPRHGGVHSMTNQQTPKALKKLEEPKAPVTFTKEYGRKEHLVAAFASAKVVQTFETNVEKATNKASCASSPSKKCLPVVSTGKGPLIAATEELVMKKPLMEALIPAKEVETSNMKTQNAINKASHTPSPSRHSSPIVNSEKLALVDLEEDISGELPMDPPIAKEHETSTMKTGSNTNKASCTFSPLMHTSPIVTPGGNFKAVAECKNSAVEERDLLNILPKFKLCHNNLPSLHVTWKGDFLFTATPIKSYGGLQARPPFTVSRKALEFSKRMPPVLQVQLLPRCQMWAELFQNNCPDLNDIALYFFPADNIERSKGNIACLIELMEVQSSMMRSCIDGVELLIFTSKQLHMDSQEYFLWGVFHAVENNQTLDKSDEEGTPFISPLECVSNDPTSMENGEAVDMEIDMVGGENVGRVDIVVSKDASTRLSGISEEETVTGSTLKTSEKKILNVSALSSGDIDKTRSDFSLELPLQSSNGKRFTVDEFGVPRFTVDQLGIPRGFEKIARTKLKDTSCQIIMTTEKPLLVSERTKVSVKKEIYFLRQSQD